MAIWKRFWSAVGVWTVALALLDLAFAVTVQFSGDFYDGSGAALMAAHGVVRTVGLFFPLIVFAAALQTVSSSSARRLRSAPFALAILPIAAGLTCYLLLGFAAPWAQSLFLESAAGRAGTPLDIPVQTQRWLAEQVAQEGIDAEGLRALGWLYHVPYAVGLLAALLAVLGILAGARAQRSTQRWAIGSLVVATVVPLFLWSSRLSWSYGVPPALTAYGMLLVPALLIALLAWGFWTDRGGSAGPEASQA
jgi:hypothetical protein